MNTDTSDRTQTDKSAQAGPASRRPGSLLSIAALIVALVSAGAAGWLWHQLREARNAQAELAEAQARELAGLEAEIQQLSQTLTGLDEINDVVGSTAEQMATELSDLRGEFGQMRTELTNQLNTGVQDRGTALLLSEAEQLMRIAAYQLQLRRNVAVASEALHLADERLAAVNDPLMASVRETLAREQQALAAVPAVDTAGAAATLGALAEQSASLPLRRDDTDDAEAEDATSPPTPPDDTTDTAQTQTGWTALMDELGESLGRLVRVQKHDENMAALLTPDEERLMRQNLQIKFETARLALLEGRAGVYTDTLGEAQRWLETYFDTGDDAVQAAMTQSSELRALNIDPMLPDISQSLRQLRSARESLAGAGSPEVNGS